MSSSDSVAGAQEQTSSESLDTTLGNFGTMASSSSSHNPGLSNPTLSSTLESSRQNTPPLIEMEGEVQGQLQLPPPLVACPTATAQAVGAQLEQPMREKVTAPSQAEPLPAGLVAALGGQATPSLDSLLLQMMQRQEQMMQRQEQQQRQMQQEMQAAQTQLLPLLVKQMYSRWLRHHQAAAWQPEALYRALYRTPGQKHQSCTPLPNGAKSVPTSAHISVITGHREMRCPRVAGQYTLTLRLTLLLTLSLL